MIEITAAQWIWVGFGFPALMAVWGVGRLPPAAAGAP